LIGRTRGEATIPTDSIDLAKQPFTRLSRDCGIATLSPKEERGE
jgi:hypothetical protein